MTLYFKGETGKRCISHPKSKEDAIKTVSAFLEEHGYKSYYRREFTDDSGIIHWDVGSHTEFFLLDKSDSDNDAPVFWEIGEWLKFIADNK